jgi:ribosome-associated translation inhibitor RaiA
MMITSVEKHRITDLVIELPAPDKARHIVPVALAERVNDHGVHLSISRKELTTYPEHHEKNQRRLTMNQPDFTFEFHSELAQPDAELRTEAESQLRELTQDHTDIVGAAVAMEELTGDETPHTFQTRIVVYMRPDNVVAVEKAPDATTSLQQALNVIERQVHEKREELREQRRQP